MNVALTRLINEVVGSRLRHRALIAVLESGKTFDWTAYVDEYVKIRERDATGLRGQILLDGEVFSEFFHEWESADSARYGVFDRVENGESPSKKPPRRSKKTTKK